MTKVKKVRRSYEHSLEPGNQDLDHEWLQLIRLEKAIDKHKNQLLEAEAGNQGDPDMDGGPFWESKESLAKRSDQPDDGDLEYISNILNSFSSPTCYHEGPSQLKLKSITPEDAPARACASHMTPPKFNFNFNQNSTTHSPGEDHSSYFSNVEDERAIELGDYFSDDDEDGRRRYWGQTGFKK